MSLPTLDSNQLNIILDALKQAATTNARQQKRATNPQFNDIYMRIAQDILEVIGIITGHAKTQQQAEQAKQVPTPKK